MHWTRIVFSTEDCILIKNLLLFMGYSSCRLMMEFLQKGWNMNSLNTLQCKIHATFIRPMLDCFMIGIHNKQVEHLSPLIFPYI